MQKKEVEDVFFRRLSEFLQERNWSASHLAKASGVSPATLFSNMRRRTLPTLINVLKICEALEVTTNDFFFGVSTREKQEELLKTILQEELKKNLTPIKNGVNAIWHKLEEKDKPVGM